MVNALRIMGYLSLFVIVHLSLSAMLTRAAPVGEDYDNSSSRGRRLIVEIEEPKQVIRTLESLIQSIAEADGASYILTEKRGIDLGMSRGFSGRQAAKHLIGLASANFANGPGRKRR